MRSWVQKPSEDPTTDFSWIGQVRLGRQRAPLGTLLGILVKTVLSAVLLSCELIYSFSEVVVNLTGVTDLYANNKSTRTVKK